MTQNSSPEADAVPGPEARLIRLEAQVATLAKAIRVLAHELLLSRGLLGAAARRRRRSRLLWPAPAPAGMGVDVPVEETTGSRR